MVASVGPVQGPADVPDAFEAPNGVEAATPNIPDDAGSRDPTSATVAGAVANAFAQAAWFSNDLEAAGSSVGHEVALPPAYTPNEGVGS